MPSLGLAIRLELATGGRGGTAGPASVDLILPAPTGGQVVAHAADRPTGARQAVFDPLIGAGFVQEATQEGQHEQEAQGQPVVGLLGRRHPPLVVRSRRTIHQLVDGADELLRRPQRAFQINLQDPLLHQVQLAQWLQELVEGSGRRRRLGLAPDLTGLHLAHELEAAQVGAQEVLEVCLGAPVGRADAEPETGVIEVVAVLGHQPEGLVSGRAGEARQAVAGRV